MVSVSPSDILMDPMVAVFSSTLIRKALAPDTQARPKPRATTAAWLVMPPRDVKIPVAAYMP